jgi:membrane-associated phospholipid phosphatase
MSIRVLLLVSVLAWPLQAADDAARSAVQSWRSPALERPMRAVTESGRPLLVGAGAVALLAGPGGRALLGEAALVLLPLNLVVEGVKWLVDRPRPDGTHRRTNAAFPSSHAANAFAVAAILSRKWPRAAAGWFALALLVAFSRMYLDRHWLTDVLAGAALGAAIPFGIARLRSGRSTGTA